VQQIPAFFSISPDTENTKSCDICYLKTKGHDLDSIEQKVCGIFGIEPAEIYSKSRRRIRAEAKGLYCYWAVEDLGYSLADLARLFGMTGQGIGYAVRRGERIAKEQDYRSID